MSFAAAKRSDPRNVALLEKSSMETVVPMTASEAVSLGLMEAWDAPPQSSNIAAFFQMQEHANASQSLGKKTEKCPDLRGKNALCVDKPCDPRSLAFITCLSAENLPSQFLDKVDPYVWFWVDNKKNLAATPEYANNDNPQYSWGCPFAFDNNLNLDGEVWDSDIGRDDLVGEIASSGGVQIDDAFLKKYDKDGDGRFQLGLHIYKNGKKMKKSRKGPSSIVKFEIELLKMKGYKLTRDEGSSSRSPGEVKAYSRIQ
jgi:hypothetical protein